MLKLKHLEKEIANDPELLLEHEATYSMWKESMQAADNKIKALTEMIEQMKINDLLKLVTPVSLNSKKLRMILSYYWNMKQHILCGKNQYKQLIRKLRF